MQAVCSLSRVNPPVLPFSGFRAAFPACLSSNAACPAVVTAWEVR
jgi:hypothetical protein